MSSLKIIENPNSVVNKNILPLIVNNGDILKILYEIKRIPIEWLIRDDFLDTLSAGAVDGTNSLPGPGVRKVTDSGNNLSLTSGLLSIATGVGTWGDPGLWLNSITRTAGRIGIFHVRRTSPSGRILMGLDTAQDGVLDAESVWFGYGANTWITARFGAYIIQLPGVIGSSIDYYVAIDLRATGVFYFIKGGGYTNWTLIGIYSFGNTATLYPSYQDSGPDPATYVSKFLRFPVNLWLPTPLASDGMSTTITDGLGHAETSGIGSGGSGVAYASSPTWSVAAGVVANTPVLQPDIVINGGFDADSDWTKGAGWAISGGRANAIAANNSTLTQSTLTVGRFYKITATCALYTSGIAYIIGLFYWDAFSGLGTKSITGLATNQADLGILGASGGSAFTGSIDNIIAEPLALSELFRTLTSSMSDDVIAQTKIASFIPNTQVGLAVRLNSPTNPTSGIVAMFLGNGNISVYEFTGSTTWTQLFTAVKAFTVNDTLQLIADGSTIGLFHITSGGIPTLIGITTTATVITGGYHGVFSTDSGNTLDNFVIYPRGSLNEHSYLDQFIQE